MNMRSGLKHALRSVVLEPLRRYCGVRVISLKKGPYDHLLDLPRYQPTSVPFFGRELHVPDGSSFYYSFKEIFQDEIYRFHCPHPYPTIIDCGANIGLSALYFKQLYPEARITAVEADPEIFDVLRRNLRANGIDDVDERHCAVAGGQGYVSFHPEGADGGRIHALGGSSAVNVEAVTLDDLITREVDFLKVDIEGAETEAFLACTKLEKVAAIFIEYHSFRDSPQTLGMLLEKLAESGFRYYVRTQLCAGRPLIEEETNLGMDLQLNIFARRGLVDTREPSYAGPSGGEEWVNEEAASAR